MRTQGGWAALAAAWVLAGLGGRQAAGENGGPDAFGYRWFNNSGSGQRVPEEWIDIVPSQGGPGIEIAALTGQDNAQAQIPIGFEFHFYGNTYTQVWVTTDGLLAFDATGLTPNNAAIPSAAAPNNLIAVFWDDLTLEAAASPDARVYYATQGNPGRRRLVVTWHQVAAKADTAARFYFQAVLRETSDTITLNYVDMNDNGSGLATGASATIGLENAAGTVGLQYGFNTGGTLEEWDDSLMFTLGVRSISGQISYAGTRQGTPYYTALWDEDADGEPEMVYYGDAAVGGWPAGYTVSCLFTSDWAIAVTLLRDEDQGPCPADPWGVWQDGTLTWFPVTGTDVTGIDITMLDGSAQNPNPMAEGFSPGDFDGDGPSDPALWRASAGKYVITNTLGGTTGKKVGVAGDIPVPGDYDGDKFLDWAVFRPSTATWYIKYARGGATNMTFGAAGDVPVPEDYDGDGRTDLAVYRRSTGQWTVRRSSDGQRVKHTVANSAGTDVPVPADWDTDGRADFAVFRPTTGRWYFDTGGAGHREINLGAAGDIPVPFKAKEEPLLAVFRPATATWKVKWFWGGAATTYTFGRTGDIPVPSDWEYNWMAQPGVYRPSNSTWYYRRDNGSTKRIPWGQVGDRPVDPQYQINRIFGLVP